MNLENVELLEVSPDELLLEAVCSNNHPKIKQLITKTPSLLNCIYPGYDKSIFLIACSNKNVNTDTISILLQLGADIRDSRSDNGWEAIHFAAKNRNSDLLDFLLEHCPECINALDKYGNNALHVLLKYGEPKSDDIHFIEKLFQNGLDANHFRNKSAIENITDQNLSKEALLIMKKFSTQDLTSAKNLTQYLNQEHETECIKEISQLSDINLINGGFPGTSSTLLQLCCRNRLGKAVKYLLDKGINVMKTTQKDSDEPVSIAARLGATEIFEPLINKYESLSKIPNNLLENLTKYIDNKELDYVGCLKVLLNRLESFVSKDCLYSEDVKSKINFLDEMHNTSLHYAVWFSNSDVVEKLLDLGAYLAAKNKYGESPIMYIDAVTLEKHLDRCIVIDSVLSKYDQNFEVKINIQSLLPVDTRTSDAHQKDLENGTQTLQKIISDTEVVFLMSKSQELKPLLTHPVVVSYLTLKWGQYQHIFWANFALFTIFAITFLMYIYNEYNIYTAQSSNLNPILSNLIWLALFASLLMLSLREFFQFCIYPKRYFKSFDNYMEVSLIIIGFFILAIKNAKQLWSISILLIAYEFVATLGKHPYLTTHVVMLRTVTYNFFRSFFIYSLLIVAFACSFHLLFITNKDSFSRENTMFKTLVMLTGEFDSSELDFNTYFISKIIFAFFIFIVHIILLNLLSGLAISDTQLIRNKAELLGHIARIEYIREIEHILTSLRCKNVFKCFLTNTSFSEKYSQMSLKGIQFYPNKNRFVFDSTKCCYFCPDCTKLRLDTITIRKMFGIIQTRYKRQWN